MAGKSFRKHVATGESCLWGVPQKSDKGTITDFSEHVTAKKYEGPGQDGTTVFVVFYDLKREMTFNIVARSNATAPGIGDLFEVKADDGTMIKAMFDDVNITYANEATKTYACTATAYEKVVPTGNEEWMEHPEDQLPTT